MTHVNVFTDLHLTQLTKQLLQKGAFWAMNERERINICLERECSIIGLEHYENNWKHYEFNRHKRKGIRSQVTEIGHVGGDRSH